MKQSDDDRAPVLIGIGASAGGVEALTSLMRHLPADLPAAVLVVLHTPTTRTSILAGILDRSGPLRAVSPDDGEPPRPGVVYVAPSDRHLVVRDGLIRLLAGPRENGHRPAVDPLLASLAAHGPRAIGVILSGTRDDGTRGLGVIKAAKGSVFVQDPEEAAFDGMVRSALEHVAVDGVLGIAPLADVVTSLARRLSASDGDHAVLHPDMQHGSSPEDDRSATRYICPDCGGALWRHEHGPTKVFRCSVGHVHSPASFDEHQQRGVEAALWAAARLLGDRHALLEEMGESARTRGHARTADGFAEQALEMEATAATIRALIESGRMGPAGPGLEAG